ncbi:organic cation transporter protein-like [Vanessa atalanta]|uniref:organic cation transporter protein-like n=1 Tax=Vanessa atalanta TaxID=42275 RepID=UPI001FCCEEA0|nr:organic cation transporter protein-like [Vanessa atalanta]
MAQINALIGNFGKYHIWLCIMIFLSKFFVAFHQMAILFLAPPVQYICPHNETCCDVPVYDKTEFTRTIVTEWNLICHKSWQKDFTQTVFQLGVLIGSLVFGLASDRFGRRIALLVAIILEIFTGLITAIMPEYWSFTVLRMFLGTAVGGVMVVSFVLLMEFIGCVHRETLSIIFHIPFIIGHIVLAVFGYYIRDYVHFQISISAVSLAQLFYTCVLPESPRWLLSRNKTFKAIKIMEHIAKINNLPIHEIRREIETFQLDSVMIRRRKQTVIDLLRNSYLRRNLLIMSFSWFVSGYCYYGVSQFISRLTGNIFLNVVTNGGGCLCGCILAIPLIKFMGRKILIISFNIASSISLITIVLIPEDIGTLIVSCVGDLFSFMAFIVLYLYCSEMFPTVVRNAAIGISSMMARFGSMIAPFVANFRIYGKWCAPVAFGVPPMIAAVLCIFLPETKGTELLMSIEESGTMDRNNYTPSRGRSTASEEHNKESNF